MQQHGDGGRKGVWGETPVHEEFLGADAIGFYYLFFIQFRSFAICGVACYRHNPLSSIISSIISEAFNETVLYPCVYACLREWEEKGLHRVSASTGQRETRVPGKFKCFSGNQMWVLFPETSQNPHPWLSPKPPEVLGGGGSWVFHHVWDEVLSHWHVTIKKRVTPQNRRYEDILAFHTGL